VPGACAQVPDGFVLVWCVVGLRSWFFFELEKLMAILNLINGYKTYIAAIGLVGLAVYQFSLGQFENGYQSILAAMTAAGLRHAIAKVSN
jgi:hypothetical protein